MHVRFKYSTLVLSYLLTFDKSIVCGQQLLDTARTCGVTSRIYVSSVLWLLTNHVILSSSPTPKFRLDIKTCDNCMLHKSVQKFVMSKN